MRAVLQRVSSASVTVSGEVIGHIQQGLLVLLGVSEGDTGSDLDYVFRKTTEMRIFTDETGKMNRSLANCGGAILVVSQFTLLADIRKGRRPSFNMAASPELASAMVQQFIDRCMSTGIKTQSGQFGADMAVQLVNDGPVTIIVDSRR